MNKLLAEISPRIAAFGSLGILTVTQDLSAQMQQVFPEFDPEIVAEESLCLVTAVTTRIILSIRGAEDLTNAVETLQSTPYTYRDYVFGQLMLHDDTVLPDGLSERIGGQIKSKMAFYDAFLERSPGSVMRTVLEDIMLLWMGRISPAGCQDSPAERVEKIGSVDLLLRHATLVASFTTHCLQGATD